MHGNDSRWSVVWIWGRRNLPRLLRWIEKLKEACRREKICVGQEEKDKQRPRAVEKEDLMEE
jgi:hypothetical protein